MTLSLSHSHTLIISNTLLPTHSLNFSLLILLSNLLLLQNIISFPKPNQLSNYLLSTHILQETPYTTSRKLLFNSLLMRQAKYYNFYTSPNSQLPELFSLLPPWLDSLYLSIRLGPFVRLKVFIFLVWLVFHLLFFVLLLLIFWVLLFFFPLLQVFLFLLFFFTLLILLTLSLLISFWEVLF